MPTREVRSILPVDHTDALGQASPQYHPAAEADMPVRSPEYVDMNPSDTTTHTSSLGTQSDAPYHPEEVKEEGLVAPLRMGWDSKSESTLKRYSTVSLSESTSTLVERLNSIDSAPGVVPTHPSKQHQQYRAFSSSPLVPSETRATSPAVISLPKSDQALQGARECVFVFCVCMAQFLCQAGLSSCLAPLDIISQQFHLNPGQASWLIAGFSLTCGTLILVAGRMGDLFGHRAMVLGGWAWFGIWSVATGCSAWSGYMLLVISRTMQGIGPAILLPNSLALLGTAYPPGKKKTLFFSLFGLSAPLGAFLGGVISAALATHAWWPWAFWVNAAFCAVLLLLCIWSLPRSNNLADVKASDGLSSASLSMPTHSDRRPSSGKSSLLSSLDPGGSMLGVTALILINVAFNQAPIVGWGRDYVITLLVLGVLLAASFFLFELCATKHPLLAKEILNSSTAYMLGCMGAGWAGFTVWLYYGQWRIYSLRNQPPLVAALQFLPCPISGGIAAFSMGWLLPHLGPACTMLIAMLAFTLGPLLASLAPLHQTYFGLTMVSVAVMPIGMDLSMPSATILLSDAVGTAQQGVVASLVCTVINYTGSLSLGVAATIEQHVVSALPPGDESTLRGYRGALYLAIGLGALGTMIALVYALRCKFLSHVTQMKKDSALSDRQSYIELPLHRKSVQNGVLTHPSARTTSIDLNKL